MGRLKIHPILFRRRIGGAVAGGRAGGRSETMRNSLAGLPDVSGFPKLMFLQAFRPARRKNPLRRVVLIEMHFRMATLCRSPQKYAEELGKSNVN